MPPAFEAAMGAAFTVTIGLPEDLEAEGFEPAVVVALPLGPDPPDLPVAVADALVLFALLDSDPPDLYVIEADALVLLAILDVLVVWFYIIDISKTTFASDSTPCRSPWRNVCK